MQKLQTSIKQNTRLSPQQIMVATMIQASTEELQALIDEELEKNFVLEPDDSKSVDEMAGTAEDEGHAEGNNDEETYEDSFDIDGTEDVKDIDYADSYADYDDEMPSGKSGSDENEYSPITNYGSDSSFRDALKEQVAIMDVSEREAFIANYLIDSMDDDGYLRRPMIELVDDLMLYQYFDTTEEELEHVLVEVVQGGLEPAGIGARNLQECLLLQLLDKKSTPAVMNAYRVVEEAFDDLSTHRYDKIKANLGLSETEISEVQKVVQRLNPKPAGVSSNTDVIEARAAHVRPDFIVTNEDGTLVVSLLNCHVPAVKVSADYNEMLKRIEQEKNKREDVKKGKSMIEDGIRSANLFISALVQRRVTLLAVMRVIVNSQREFFLSGKIENLLPMTLKNVSEASGYDISTISRVTNNRYAQTDFGTISLKELFTTGVESASGQPAVSNAAIKNALREIVDGEDKSNPLNDDELMKRLAEMGYTIARRTVVKYREALGISKKNLRKR